MNNRLRKQIIIGAVFLLIFVGIGGSIYLSLRPQATCSDNKKNQKETEVDCGGPCISCDLKNNPPIIIKQKPAFLLIQDSATGPVQNKVNIFFQLMNTDNEWGAKSFSYSLMLRAASGETQQLDYTGFILPHELKTFILPHTPVNFIPQSIDLVIHNQTIVWSKPVEGVNLALGNPFVFSGVRIREPILSSDIYKNIYTFTKTLKLGMTDPEVFNLQKVLSKTPSIYPEGKITGYFGKATETAVKKFQTEYGIRATGEVGPQTRAKLNELYGQKGQRIFNYTFDVNKILKMGMQGADVINLQQALALDFGSSPKGAVSGIFDKATKEAVLDFQIKYNIKATGQVGPTTAAKLNELFSSPQESAPQQIQETFESFEAALRVEGTIYNTTPFNWKQGDIVVVLCDKDKNPAAIGKITLDNIASGKTMPFLINWHHNVPDGLTICTQEAQINVLDLNNVLTSGK